MSPPASRRPVIGLLANSLYEGYEGMLWRSVVRAAKELDADLLCFLGGALGDETQRSTLFDLVKAESVDGLVVFSASVGMFSGPEAIPSLLARMVPLPTVSVSERLPGVPSLLVDNGAGIWRGLEHLFASHGRRRIAFVEGPPSSWEARARAQAYREGLERLGLRYDPELVVEGDFGPASGLRAVRTLLDGRRVTIDALIAANDLMAISAMDELRRRGVDVPGDVAVCGFDDVNGAASATPPLSTVRQPLQELGRDAVRLVLALIRGEAVDPVITYPAQLVVRQSCGCSELGGRQADTEAPGPGAAASVASHLERSFPELGNRIGIPSWAAELGAALEASSGEGGDQVFLQTLRRLLSRGFEELPAPATWFQVIRQAMAWVQRRAAAGDLPRLASLSGVARELVGVMAASAEMARRERSEVETRELQRLIQPFPLPDSVFIRNLLEGLDTLGVRSFFLIRYLSAERREARLIAHRDLDGVAELEEPSAAFAAHRLIPGRFSRRRRRAHAVLPIQSPSGPIGFALCEIGPMGSFCYQTLVHQMSMVLSMNALMAEVQDQHRQLLETARQAGMAEVAVGALHNVGNLLNSVSVSAEEIREIAVGAAGSGLPRASALLTEHAADLPGFFARDPRASVLPAYLDRAGQELLRALDRIQTESLDLQEKTGLVRDSIRALQDHTRSGRDHPMREVVEIPVLVRAALEIQRAQLDRFRVQVRQELDGVPPLVAPRAKLVHVLVNLVKNAIEAMHTTPEDRRLLVIRAAPLEDGRIRLEVQDSGEGISAENLGHIFSHGFTTKREGHGFGLSTCASYMKQMGGSISVTSDGVGRGSAFVLTFEPRSAVDGS